MVLGRMVQEPHRSGTVLLHQPDRHVLPYGQSYGDGVVQNETLLFHGFEVDDAVESAAFVDSGLSRPGEADHEVFPRPGDEVLLLVLPTALRMHEREEERFLDGPVQELVRWALHEDGEHAQPGDRSFALVDVYLQIHQMINVRLARLNI